MGSTTNKQRRLIRPVIDGVPFGPYSYYDEQLVPRLIKDGADLFHVVVWFAINEEQLRLARVFNAYRLIKLRRQRRKLLSGIRC